MGTELEGRMIGRRLKNEFGRKIYKLSLDIGCTCPTRDGTKGTRGCIFCSQAGSGDFSERYTGKQEELDRAKERLGAKIDTGKAGYIAYFQNYTNTYAPAEYLGPLFEAPLADKNVVGISIATRPDCLGPEIIALIRRLCMRTTVFVELGLQTIHDSTAAFIRRGFPLADYDRAVGDLRAAGARVVTHLIFGLPYPSDRPSAEKAEFSLESTEMMLESVRYVARSGVEGVKFQLLQVLRGTDLAELYQNGAFRTLTMDEYVDVVVRALSILPDSVSIHRLTGDPPRRLLIAPDWATDKKRVLNKIRERMVGRNQIVSDAVR